MEAMRKAWTDERLDVLSERVDRGFDRVGADLRALNGRFDALQRVLIQIGAGLIVGLVGVMATIIGLVITQI
ncbi:MAG: hypothetical protein JWM24_1064 [Solirubrobacterales bacterium]|nr:hypothetical protein [Solirubrobacterales bacterium]